MIGDKKDFDDQFFRMATIALAKTMNKSIRWINYFEPQNDKETGRKRVLVPFYTSLTGDERFNLDTFVDDVVDTRVTMNTDQMQKGVITLTNIASRSDEFANANQYLAKKTEINNILRKVISKVKAVPVTINYDIEIHLASQNEVDKCSQKIMTFLFNYMFFNIDYYGIKIDAIVTLPDDKTIEIPREITMDSDRKKTIKFSLEVKSYFPIFRIDTDDLIICDNDNEIDWDYIGIPQPTEDFLQSVKDYNASYGNMNIKGGPGGSDEIEGMTAINRVFWEDFLHKNGQQESINEERNTEEKAHPENWKKNTLNDPTPPTDNDI